MCEPITNETSLEPGHRRQPYLSGACDAAELAAVPPQPFRIEVRLDREPPPCVLSGGWIAGLERFCLSVMPILREAPPSGLRHGPGYVRRPVHRLG